MGRDGKKPGKQQRQRKTDGLVGEMDDPKRFNPVLRREPNEMKQ